MEKASPTTPDTTKAPAAPAPKVKRPSGEKTADLAKKNERKIFKAAVVDATKLVEAQAKDIGDHKMTESKEDRSKSWFKRKVTQIWKHNLFQEYYRHKKIAEARGEIIASGDLYKGEEGADAAAHVSAMNAIVERFTSEYEEDMLKKSEKGTKQTANAGANAELKKLIEAYAADPKMSPAAFKEEQKRILSSVDKDYAKEGTLYADNLLAIATEVRDSVAHGEKLSEMDFEVELTLGKAQESLNTEAKKSFFEKMQNTKVGRVVMNEPTVAAACAAAYGIATKISQRLASSKLAAWGSFGATAVLSGSLSAAKEAARVERERAQHSREMAKGKVFDKKDMPRREEMEKNRYLSREASDIQAKLAASLVEVKAGRLDASSLTTIMADLADLETRVRLGDQKKIDLVTYSSAGKVEEERTNLDLARAELKVALRAAGAEKLADKTTTGTFDEYLDKMVEINTGALMGGENGIEAKDKIFSKMKRSRAMKAFATTAIAGAVIGVGFQEVRGLFPGEDGLLKGSVKGIHDHFAKEKWNNFSEHATALEGLRRYMAGTDPRLPMGTGHDVVMGSTHLRFPDGVDLHPNDDGTFSIMHGGDVMAKDLHLALDAHGDLTDTAKQALAAHNIHTSSAFVIGPNTAHANETADAYLKEHPELTHRVHRELFYDQNTPHHPDFNEKKEWWGGEKGTGVDANGNYVLNMKRMVTDGSYHGASSVDAPAKMSAHGLKMLFSLSKGTQHQVFEVPIDTDGNAIIPKDSEIAKLMFETGKDGHAVFTGQFAEVAEATGLAQDGGENVRILSTVVGHGRDMIEHGGSSGPEVTVRFDVPKPWDYDVPPFVPLVPRIPLERAEKKKVIDSKDKKINTDGPLRVEPMNMYGYGYGYGEAFDKEKVKKDFSPRLRENSEAALDPKEEINWYFEDQKRRYPGYLEHELAELAKQNPEPIGSKVEGVVCLAVAGHQEHANIYRTLETYRDQKNKDGESIWKGDKSNFEIFIYVNWPQGTSPELSLAEIERFKNKNPGIPVRVYSEEITNGKVEVGWYKKKIFDLALQKKQQAGTDGELLLIANDADMTFSSPRYLEDVSRAMKDPKNGKYDAMLGRYDLDQETYEKYPTFHSTMRFWQYMEAGMRSEYEFVGTQGRNTVMRGSSYAAVGGNRTRDFWGDIEFGQFFEQARGRSSVGYVNSAWLTVDPRREIDKFKNGEPVAYTWSDFNTRQIRGVSSMGSVEENLDVHALASASENDPMVAEFRERIQKEVQEIINLFTTITPGASAPEAIIRKHVADMKVLAQKAARFLGVGIEMTETGSGLAVKLTDTSKLRTQLEKYKEFNKKEIKQRKHVTDLEKKEVKRVASTEGAETPVSPSEDRAARLESIRKANEEAARLEAAKTAAPKAPTAPAAVATPSAAPVAPTPERVAGRETMSSLDVKKSVRSAIEESLRDAGSSARISGDLDVMVNDGTIVVRGDLVSSRLGAGKSSIEMTLGVRGGNQLVFEVDPTVKAGILARGSIARAIDDVPERLMETLAGDSKKKLEAISISGTDKTLSYKL